MNKHILKIICGLILILTIVFSWSVFCDKLLTRTSENIDSTAAELEDHIKNDKWDEANKTLKTMQEDWDKTEPKWAMLIDHFEIDNIENSVTRMSKYVEEKSTEDALAELGSIRKYIQHIPLKNALSLKNVL